MEKEMANYIIEAESAGAEGQLDRSQKFVKKAEDLKIELESVKKVNGLKNFIIQNNSTSSDIRQSPGT